MFFTTLTPHWRRSRTIEVSIGYDITEKLHDNRTTARGVHKQVQRRAWMLAAAVCMGKCNPRNTLGARRRSLSCGVVCPISTTRKYIEDRASIPLLFSQR